MAIGAKYSIEHELISPLTRIILGYLIGAGLMVFAIKLKKNYENFSAVLLSGAIAIMYFITYAAYSFYGLFPQLLAFILMVLFTVFTVVAAINYNRQVIAHIGLVGAYAVPFLLSDGSGRVLILFSYVAIINIGILIIAFQRNWKSLNYSAFVFTWIIFYTWFSKAYTAADFFLLSFTFITIYFITFYLILLGYKIIKREVFAQEDGVMLILNSFFYFGLGYVILSSRESTEPFIGLFTIGNAIVHFIVCAIIYKKKLADQHLFYLVAGLVLVFITIAIPIQLSGNWVTLLWAGEAALLFWVGRTKKVALYEQLSYAVMVIAFFSLIEDWITSDTIIGIDSVQRFTPVFNLNFLSSLLFIAAFAFINYINQRFKKTGKDPFVFINRFLIPAILLIVIYFAFRSEISNYWQQKHYDSFRQHITPGDTFTVVNENNQYLKAIWLLNFTLVYFALLSFINLKFIRNERLAIANVILNILVIVLMLTDGIYNLGLLRHQYITPAYPQYYPVSSYYIWIRYITFALGGVVIFYTYRYLKSGLIAYTNLRNAIDIFLALTVLMVLSSELVTWMDLFKFPQSFKLGLSILWGVYSLILISIGIARKLQHIRFLAIVLFAVTLIKLFVYDISDLDTIAKTIVFVVLGILLLIISFLYNKYKGFLSGDDKT